MSVSISTNMSMPIPGVGTEDGPQWATDLNNSLTIVDQHDHSLGKGVQINSSGINIIGDFPFNNNRATTVRSISFTAQPSPLSGITNVGSLYEAGVDLYYNDGSGNQIRMTQGGSIAGAAGSISGLVSPASASYQAGPITFVWQSNTNTSANMDAGSYIFRNTTALSNGITVSAPAALASNYSIVWPTLPASSSFVTIDNAGNMGTSVISHGITQSMLELRSTGTTVGSGGVAISASCGGYTVFAFPSQITNFNLTITTTGRPVKILMQSDFTTNGAFFSVTGNDRIHFELNNNATAIQRYTYVIPNAFSSGSIEFLDTTVNGSPGTYVYSINAFTNATTATVNNYIMTVYEI